MVGVISLDILSIDVVGSANNKAKTLRMEHVNGRKFTEEKKKNKVKEIQLANLAILGSLASKNRILGKYNDNRIRICPQDFFTFPILILRQ